MIRMDLLRTVKKLTEWEPCPSRPVRKPRLSWIDQVEEDLKKRKVRSWREKCKCRRLWNEIVKQEIMDVIVVEGMQKIPAVSYE
jgi:hypothetical protein